LSKVANFSYAHVYLAPPMAGDPIATVFTSEPGPDYGTGIVGKCLGR